MRKHSSESSLSTVRQQPRYVCRKKIAHILPSQEVEYPHKKRGREGSNKEGKERKKERKKEERKLLFVLQVQCKTCGKDSTHLRH